MPESTYRAYDVTMFNRDNSNSPNAIYLANIIEAYFNFLDGDFSTIFETANNNEDKM